MRFLHWLLVCALAAGCATVKTKDEMTAQEIAALEESQQRVESYRQTLRTTSDRETRRQLRALLGKELDLQDAIIRKDPQLKAKAAALRDGIHETAKFSAALALFLGMAVLQSLAENNTTITP